MMAGEVSSPETAARLLAHLRASVDQDGCVKVGVRALAARLDIGRNTAHTALRRLISAGQIAVVRPGTGCDYATTYRLAIKSNTCADHAPDEVPPF